MNRLCDPDTLGLVRAVVPTTPQLISLTIPSLFLNASSFLLSPDDTRGDGSNELSALSILTEIPFHGVRILLVHSRDSCSVRASDCPIGLDSYCGFTFGCGARVIQL